MEEYFKKAIDWLCDNKEWVFSGIGLTVCSLIGFVFKLFKKKTKNKSVQQKASFNIGSHIIQVNGDFKTNGKNYE